MADSRGISELRRLSEDLARRHFLTHFPGTGLSVTPLPGVLRSRLQDRSKITAQTLSEAGEDR